MSYRNSTVCQVLHSLQVGGAEILASRLAGQFQHDCRFVFVCLDQIGSLGQQLRDQGFSVHALQREPGLDWICARRLGELLRRERVDLIHAHQYTPFFYAQLGRLLHRRPSILFTEHGRHHPDFPRRKRILANRLVLERRDRVVGVGEAVRQALVQNEGIPSPRVDVIYNGIDLAPFANGHEHRALVRREIGIDGDAFLIIQVARLDYLKDHATAIHTLDAVLRQQPKARLVLVGEGPERQALEALVRERHLDSHVLFLGLRSDVPRLLAGADAFLLTSISEGIPLTLIEAMAAGVPVVATQVGGVAEVLEDGQSGLLAPAKDASALADRLLRIAADARLRHELSVNGRERARLRFSEQQMHQQYARLYREMLHGARN